MNEQELKQLKNDVAELKKWKEQKTRQQINYPIDTNSLKTVTDSLFHVFRFESDGSPSIPFDVTGRFSPANPVLTSVGYGYIQNDGAGTDTLYVIGTDPSQIVDVIIMKSISMFTQY